MLKLWGRVNSINVMKVLWTLEELGVPFERVDAGMNFGVVNTPEYKAMNPNSRVPTLQDGGLTLFESNAIVRYLAAKHGAGRLWAVDPGERADSDRWMDWATTTVQPAMTPVFWQLIRTPADKRDMKAVEEGKAATAKAMEVLEWGLGGKPFIAGSTLTMGDIIVGVWVHRWFALPIDRPAMPAVQAYHQRLLARPA